MDFSVKSDPFITCIAVMYFFSSLSLYLSVSMPVYRAKKECALDSLDDHIKIEGESRPYEVW